MRENFEHFVYLAVALPNLPFISIVIWFSIHDLTVFDMFAASKVFRWRENIRHLIRMEYVAFWSLNFRITGMKMCLGLGLISTITGRPFIFTSDRNHVRASLCAALSFITRPSPFTVDCCYTYSCIFIVFSHTVLADRWRFWGNYSYYDDLSVKIFRLSVMQILCQNACKYFDGCVEIIKVYKEP